jgi:hypothetical protein
MRENIVEEPSGAPHSLAASRRPAQREHSRVNGRPLSAIPQPLCCDERRDAWHPGSRQTHNPHLRLTPHRGHPPGHQWSPT